MRGIVVIDVGTTGVRGAVVSEHGEILTSRYVQQLPDTPGPGMVEHDATALVEAASDVAESAITDARGVDLAGLGIAVQRSTTVVWDGRTGEPVGPALGWQDLRTIGACLELGAKGIRIAPNESGTKAQWLVAQAESDGIAAEHLKVGTLDSWIAWRLSGGRLHATDLTNAGVTGLFDPASRTWDPDRLGALGVPPSAMAEIVPTSGLLGTARLAGREIPIAALVGDQQASLVGQGGIRPGVMKATLGTACMVDVNTGTDVPVFERDATTYPIVVAATPTDTWFGREATVITAGEAIRGMVDLGIAASPDEVSRLAAEVPSSDGVRFVPAMLGLGTPYWDYGARGTLVGLSLKSGKHEIARAVLEGVAWRVSECVRQLEADTRYTVAALRVDGGGAASDLLCQAQADRLGIPVLRSRETEATTLGVGLLAGLATGVHDHDSLEAIPGVDREFLPAWDGERRAAESVDWESAVRAAKEWVPALSLVRF